MSGSRRSGAVGREQVSADRSEESGPAGFPAGPLACSGARRFWASLGIRDRAPAPPQRAGIRCACLADAACERMLLTGEDRQRGGDFVQVGFDVGIGCAGALAVMPGKGPSHRVAECSFDPRQGGVA